MSQETRHETIERNELRKLQEGVEVWKEVIQWVKEGRVPKLLDMMGKIQEAITVRKFFFVIHQNQQNVKAEQVKIIHLEQWKHLPPLPSFITNDNMEISNEPENETAETEEK